jgi:hypothetical protein
MMLVSPQTGEEEIGALVAAIDGALSLLADASLATRHEH